MQEDTQTLDNIDSLQAYYNMLKDQGYSDEEINQIIQQELTDQQEEFINNNEEGEQNQINYQESQQKGYEEQEQQEYRDHIEKKVYKNEKQNENGEYQYNYRGQQNQQIENEGNDRNADKNQYKNTIVRSYDKNNFLIKPHIEQEKEQFSNYNQSSIASHFQFQHQQTLKQLNPNSNQSSKQAQGLTYSQESFKGVLGEKNMQNIHNRVQEQYLDQNSIINSQNRESLSRGSITNTQKNDSIQQFAPLRFSEKIAASNIQQNLQQTLKLQFNQSRQNNMQQNLQEKQIINSNNTQKYFNQNNQIVQKSDENNINTQTAHFNRFSIQDRANTLNDQPKIQARSRSRTPPKQQKPAKIISAEEKKLLELKNKLRTVFTFYVSFGDRINVNYLKSNKFHKMMSDAQLKDNVILTQNRLDLMFVKENQHKHNMDFDTFLNLITKISILKFPQFNEAQSLQMILQNHFLPLYDNIMAETDLGEDELKFKEPIDDVPFIILKEVCPVLVMIYQNYFTFEWKNRGNEVQVKQKSEKYDICPTLVTKSSAFLLFREILDLDQVDLSRNAQLRDLSFFLSDDQGSQFTFWKFAVYLIRISNICYSNLFNQLEQPPEGANRTTAEKLAFLLERMELSSGFLNLDKKNQSNLSLIIKKKVLNRFINKYFSYIHKMLSNGKIIGGSQISSVNQSSTGVNITQYSLQNGLQIQQPLGQISSTSPGADNSVIPGFNNMSTFDNGSVQSQSTANRVNRSRSDLRLRQSANGLADVQQQCIRNYSPIGFVNNSMQMNEQQRQVMIAHVQNMQNYKLFKNPLGLADLQCVENIQLIDNYSDSLMAIFQSYCSFGDAMNTQWMKSAKFTKLMREANIINTNSTNNIQNNNNTSTNLHSNNNQNTQESNKYLTPCDVDLIFIKASKKRSGYSISNSTQIENSKLDVNKLQQRLDFEQFLVSLEMVACKLFKEQTLLESMNTLLYNYILPLTENGNNNSKQSENKKNNVSTSQNKSVHSSTQNEHVSILMDILKDQEVVDVLGLIHKSMMAYYKYYSQNKSTIDFDKFVKFCKDFGIFPDITPKSRLLKIFNTLAQIYNTTEMAQNSSSNSIYNYKLVIDQHLFIEAIALCAFEVQYSDPQPSEIEKICYLVERMNQSGGQIMIQKQIGHTRSQSNNSVSWDIIQPLRKKYPQFFSYCSQNFQNNHSSNTSNSLLLGNNHSHSIHQKQSQNNQNNGQKTNMFDYIIKKGLNMQQEY